MLTDENHSVLLRAMDDARITAAWGLMCNDLIAELAPYGLAVELEVNLFETHRANQVHERLFKPVAALQAQPTYFRLRCLLESDGALIVYLLGHDETGFGGLGPSEEGRMLLRERLIATPPLPGWRAALRPEEVLATAWLEGGFCVEEAGWRATLAQACLHLDSLLRP